MKTVYVTPQGRVPESKPVNGIQQLVNAQHDLLPAHGWMFVERADGADLRASHAGSQAGKSVDVAHCHGLYPTGERPFSKVYYEINARVISDLRVATAVTVPSEWVADLLRRDMHLQPVVMPHGIPLDQWPNRPAGGLPKRPVLIWNKNRAGDVCDTEPVEELANARLDLNFLTTFARTRGKNMHVIGLVPHAKMRKHLYASHVYLATTRETFGIGTLEAMAAGLPVVGYRWGATPDLVTDDCGMMVAPGDVQALSYAVSKVLGSWDAMSMAAQARAALFGWDKVIGRYAELYDSVVDGRTTEGPAVTVVIPCYNYQDKVARAVRSVMAQSFTDLECIVVNDGSQDKSAEVIKAAIANDDRFHLLNQKNSGVAEARNRGFREGLGRYLCPLDADDAMAPEFLQTVVGAMEQDKSISIGYTGLAFQYRDRARKSAWPPQCDFDQHAAGKNQIPTCNVMRRKVFERTGGYRQRFHPAEDAELWLRVGAAGMKMVKVSSDPLFFYDMHADSASDPVRRGQKKEPNWRYDHPWAENGHGHVPFANLGSPAFGVASHPVVNYDVPVVAIIIPVGPGHEELVLHALDSVEAQTDWRWECVVVDDTEHQTLELPGRPWAKVVRTGGKGEKGPAFGRNLGVRSSTAPLLTFLDADDFLLPPFLERAFAVFEPGFYVYTDYYDELGKQHRAQVFDEEMLRHKSIHSVTFLHERTAWEAAGGFNEELEGYEDWDYVQALAASGCCGILVREPLLVYRFMAGQRREMSMAINRKLRPQIQGKWRDVAMGCCGGDKRRPAARSPVPVKKNNPAPVGVEAAMTATPATKKRPPGMTLMRYTGMNQGMVLIRCPKTGNKYRYGRASAILHVRPEDVDYLLAMPQFVLHQKGGKPPPPMPPPAPKPKVDAAEYEDALPEWAKIDGADVQAPHGAGPVEEVAAATESPEDPGAEVDTPHRVKPPTVAPTATEPIPGTKQLGVRDFVKALRATGLTPKQIDALTATQFLDDFAGLATATEVDLMAVKGIGPAAVRKIRAAIEELRLS